ncbi:MAG: thioredoxin family protein [Deltaproteobacteria bacterium]
MSKDIWVIGVAAACPRCDLLGQRVEKLAKEILPSPCVKKMLNTDAQAIECAAALGKKITTVKEIAASSRIKIDWKHFTSVAHQPPTPPEDIDSLEGPARQWSPELDEALRPYQEYAESTGVLLTPVLVVGGDVKHHGSVPSIHQIRSWLF